MSQKHPLGPIVQVVLTVDGETFTQDIAVSLEGLSAAIVDRALAFTVANDAGDAASAAFDAATTDVEREAAASVGDEADEGYNREKAQLFMLCRLLSSAKAQAIADAATEAIDKARGGPA